MRIVFVRHGEPNYRLDALTELGHLQAREVAERVRYEGISEIYSSPMGRARETASYTSEILDLPVTVLDFMHEIGWNSKNGEPLPHGGHPWTIPQVMVNGGRDVYDPEWRLGEYYINNDVTDKTAFVEEKGDEWLASLGYEREGKYYRVTKDDTEKTIAVFSHGGSSTALIAHMLNIAFPAMCLILRPYFTAVTVIKIPNDTGKLVLPTVEIMSDSRHASRK